MISVHQHFYRFFFVFRYGENIYNGVWKWEDSPDVMNVSFPESLKVFAQNLGSNRTLWAHNGALRPAGAAKQHEETEERKRKEREKKEQKRKKKRDRIRKKERKKKVIQVNQIMY